MNKEEIKCPKCGFINAFGTKKCYKCKEPLTHGYVSCPKCAKKNKPNATKCVSCGFNLKKKRRSLLLNLVFSILLVVFLFLCVHFDKVFLVKRVSIAFKVIVVLIMIGIIYFTLTYGKKDVLTYDAEEDMNNKNPAFNRMKLISSIAVIVGITIAAITLIIVFIVKK